MLDKPEFFYDSEPTLEPLYKATRDYLEIDRRVLVLNERCNVFLELSQILSDSIADKKMTKITWIIIVLIVISIVVTCSEVFLRFGLLTTGKNNANGPLGNGTVGTCNCAAMGWVRPEEQVIMGTYGKLRSIPGST